MAFGEVIHYVPHRNAWPEQVRGIAFLLLPPSSAGQPNFQASKLQSSDAVPEPSLYTAIDFQHLIRSVTAQLNVIAELPNYGGARSTVPLWSQLLHALANTLSPEVLIREDTPFILPRAQDAAIQPSELIDGHATLIVAHVICATPRARALSHRSDASSGGGEHEHEMIYSADSSHRDYSDESSSRTGSGEYEDALMYSAHDNSRHGSPDALDGLDLPLEAHMLPGRWKWDYAVLPVLVVADTCNIVPLICSTLYQRRVWGIREPVVGLCCSNTGTIAITIFGWLDSDQSDENCMPVPHLALAAVDHLDPLMGVFDFADTCSATTLAEFVLRLRSHFQDIKSVASIETVDYLTPFRWRSDLPDFETQIEGQSEDRVAFWVHQVHVQTSSSETSSSVGPRTPSPLSDPSASLLFEKMSHQDLDSIPEEGESGAKSGAPRSTVHKLNHLSQPRSSKDKSESMRSSGVSHKSTHETEGRPYSNSVFAALSDNGLGKTPTISNWLFERMAFTVGRIEMAFDDPQAAESGINKMIKIYDDMTGFTWSDAVQRTLSVSTIDTSVSDVRDDLFKNYGNSNNPSPIDMPKEDINFISAQLSVLLHAVRGAVGCQGISHLHGANEAERRHEWDALLIKFFQPVSGQRDVLLERTLNSARNVAAADGSFAQRAPSLTQYYAKLCFAQYLSIPDNVDQRCLVDQTIGAHERAIQFTRDINRRAYDEEKFHGDIVAHSRKDPSKGISDAVLVISCPGVTTAMLRCIQGEVAQETFLKSFILVYGKPDKQGATPPPLQERHRDSPQPDPTRQLQVPSSSHVSARKQRKEQNAMLQNIYLIHPDRKEGASQPLEEKSLPEASERDLLLPVLLTEYKKKDDSTIVKATNQMRTYLVSALRFLDALGITEQPVFGLVVNGHLGGVVMAWQKQEKIYILERNLRHYDITDPLEAFQFVSVLLRLSRYGLDLRAHFDAKKDTLYESIRTSTYTRWSKLAQIREDAQDA